MSVPMGRHSYGNPRVLGPIWPNSAMLTIGAFCSLADCDILLAGEHRTDWISTFPFASFPHWNVSKPDVAISKGNVVIGNDVWIGHHAVILSGVTIGDGAVIGTDAVVASDVLPYRVVIGNPARVLRQRFDDDTIQFLLALRWWDWPDDKIRQAAPILMSNDIDALRRFAGVKVQ